MSDMTPAWAIDRVEHVAGGFPYGSEERQALDWMLDHARAAVQPDQGQPEGHDPHLIEWLLAMTPGTCEVHDFAVFNEGGAPPPCPWCQPAAPAAAADRDALPRLMVDREADAAYVYLTGDSTVDRTVQLGYGVNVDLDSEGNVVGVELLSLTPLAAAPPAAPAAAVDRDALVRLAELAEGLRDVCSDRKGIDEIAETLRELAALREHTGGEQR